MIKNRFLSAGAGSNKHGKSLKIFFCCWIGTEYQYEFNVFNRDRVV